MEFYQPALFCLLVLIRWVYGRKDDIAPTYVTGDPSICAGDTELYSDPDDCRKFYKCSNGIAYHRKCPLILHFNPKLKVCTLPGFAGCKKPPSNPEPSSTTSTGYVTGNPSTCTTSYGLYPHPNCEKFFHCVSGIAYEMNCPGNLHFNVKLKTCDEPSNAGCENLIRPTNKVPIILGDPKLCKQYGDLVSNPHDCRTFYHCNQGSAYLKTCPSFLHFNPKLKVCDAPELSGCVQNS